MTTWTEAWKFETKNTRVVFEITDCEDDPREHFDDKETAQAVADGTYTWFDCRVRVLVGTIELGYDVLCCCSYNSVHEFFTAHRDSNPMNRNCTIMRRKHGAKVCICHYFPDMVRCAIADARKNRSRLTPIRAA